MTEQYILYQYDSCPYCRRVRQFLDGVDVSVPMRDILLDREAYIDLIRGGGKGRYQGDLSFRLAGGCGCERLRYHVSRPVLIPCQFGAGRGPQNQ